MYTVYIVLTRGRVPPTDQCSINALTIYTLTIYSRTIYTLTIYSRTIDTLTMCTHNVTAKTSVGYL